MRKEYDTIATIERDGFTILVEKTWEDIHPKDMFDDSCYDIKEMCNKIDCGVLDWFMLRIRVLVDEFELASDYLGGCLYEDAREVLTDGTAEDLISEALSDAKSQVHRVYKQFQTLSFALDREGVEC